MRANPLTYGVSVLREVLYGPGATVGELAVLMPAPRMPSTRARSRATDGFSAMTSCTAASAYRFSEGGRSKLSKMRFARMAIAQ